MDPPWIKTITVGTRPRTVAVNALTRMVYVTNEGDHAGGFGIGSVSVINGTSNTVVASITIDTPFGIAAGVAASAQRVFVAGAPNRVSAISTASNTVVGTVTIPSRPAVPRRRHRPRRTPRSRLGRPRRAPPMAQCNFVMLLPALSARRDLSAGRAAAGCSARRPTARQCHH